MHTSIYVPPQLLPELCSLGYQSGEGSTTCSPCPSGYGCPSPSHPTLNYPCLPGFYSESGNVHCTPCPPGSACPNVSRAEIIPCEAGSYSLDGSTDCIPCPAGWQCPYVDSHGNAPCPLVSGIFRDYNVADLLSICMYLHVTPHRQAQLLTMYVYLCVK